jgi:hypothetical protein
MPHRKPTPRLTRVYTVSFTLDGETSKREHMLLLNISKLNCKTLAQNANI